MKPGVNIPIRLVTNLSQSVTARFDKFINWKYLQPLQDECCQDLVGDSTEAFQWLEGLNTHPHRRRANGFAWVFVSLYDNLTPKLVKIALKSAIKECRPHWNSKFVNCLMALVELSLDASFARYKRIGIGV